MKKYITYSLLLACVTLALTSCEAKFYDEEQYRKEIYIVSDGSQIFGQEYTFGEESLGYLSIYAGGTTPIERDVEVELEYWPLLLRTFNRTIWGESYASYAKELDASCYTIDDYTVTLSKDNDKPYTRFPIRVNVSSINPDDIYYIPLRIKSVSDYMISEDKREVLFRIYVKNDYASTKSTTYYTMNGTEQMCKEEEGGVLTPTGEPSTINATKPLTPVGEQSVRIMPGTNYSTAALLISQKGVRVTVHPDQTVSVPVLVEGVPTGETLQRQLVTLSTWEETSRSVVVLALDDTPSYYDPDTKTFTLNYRYKQPSEANWHVMHEVMSPLNITD